MSPCEVHLTAPGRWTMTYGGTLLVTPQLGTAATFDQYVRSLPPWEEELLLHIDSTLDPYSISDALTFGICAVSDGSVWDNHQGAYGWIIIPTSGSDAVQEWDRFVAHIHTHSVQKHMGC
jgi:hypothetical protein